MPRDQLHAFIATIWPDEPDIALLQPASYYPDYEKRIKYWAGQYETCPTTERIHGHIYCEFHRDYRARQDSVIQKFTTVTGTHCDISKQKFATGSARQGAINYVLDAEKRSDDHQDFVLFPEDSDITFNKEYKEERLKKKRIRETEKMEIIQHILNKPWYTPWDQILHESLESQLLLCDCSWAKKFHEGRAMTLERRSIKNVIIFYGVGGSGKTHMAKNWDIKDDEPEHVRYYRRNYDDGNFWGGGNTAYRNQRIIHLDEYVGQEKFSDFKEICDIGNRGKHVNIKNGGIHLNHETVIITSNVHPAYWYRNVMKKDADHQWLSFWRRITNVYFFPPLREDGTRNIASDIESPYFIDQSNDWLTLQEWKDAKAHAALH